MFEMLPVVAKACFDDRLDRGKEWMQAVQRAQVFIAIKPGRDERGKAWLRLDALVRLQGFLLQKIKKPRPAGPRLRYDNLGTAVGEHLVSGWFDVTECSEPSENCEAARNCQTSVHALGATRTHPLANDLRQPPHARPRGIDVGEGEIHLKCARCVAAQRQHLERAFGELRVDLVL